MRTEDTLQIFESSPAGSPRDRPRLDARVLGALAVLYTVLAVLYVYDGWPALRSTLIGEPVDTPMYLWFTWWGREALFELHANPYETGHLYYPLGTGLVFSPLSVVNSLIGAPFAALFDGVVAYNIVLLSTYTLTGLAMYAIVYDLTGSRRAALVAGVMAAFAPFRLSAVTWLNFAVTHWILLYWWALWRAVRRRSVLWGACAGVFAVLALESGFTLFLFAAMSGVLAATIVLLAARREIVRVLPALATLVAVILVLGAPTLWMLASELAEYGNYAAIHPDTRIEGKPLTSLVVPGPAELKQVSNVLRASFLGYTVLLAAGTAMVLHRRRAVVWFWAVAAGFFLILSLGDHLNLSGPISFGNASDAPRLPYFYLKGLPVFENLRVPHRFGIPGSLCLVVLAGIGLAAWEARLARRLRARALDFVTVLLVAVVMLELAIPLRGHYPPRTFPLVSVPDVLAEIADDPREMCVLHEPAGFKGDSMVPYYMIHHRRPICIQGRSSRMNPEVRRAIDRSPLLRGMRNAFRHPERVAQERPWIEAARREAERARVGWIVLSRSTPTRNQPKDQDRVDAFVKLAFPSAERRYWLSEEQIRASTRKDFQETGVGRQSTVFAVYRVPW